MVSRASLLRAIVVCSVFAFALGIQAKPMAHKKAAKKPVKKASKKVKKPTPVAALVPVAGTWFLITDAQKEDKTTKIVLDPFGKFVFSGSGWKSEGTYSFKDGAIELVWAKIDGRTVPAASMHKTLALNTDAASFKIDKFTYGKHGTYALTQ